MGECFLWYRPTRVVPDQRPLNGRCCCCSFVKCLLSFVKMSWMQQLQHTYALSRKPPGNLEMVTEFNIFQEKSGNCLGKNLVGESCLLPTSHLELHQFFYTLLLDCIACFKDYAASFIIINVYVFYSLCTGSSDICVR